MPAHHSGRARITPPAADPADRSRRLARAVAAMIPQAATARVSQRDPAQVWPSPHLRAYDAHGHQLPVTRAKALTAARWIIRAHPTVDWTGEAHDLDLTTGTLRPAAEAYATAGGR
ncbi:hypothetical protein ABZ714_00280 [Streptomyces sp. NPDC006798]|nr:hypothetical protein [Streptomyces clavuligerus]WDN55699.1 hypothetical protein LL058_11865 [Streptomyces clavuligerus]